jgi:PAS domain S-box-containing protein
MSVAAGEQAGMENAGPFGLILEHIDQGVLLVDASLRVIAFNRLFLELHDYEAGFAYPGMGLIDLVRRNALMGEYGEGDIEELVRHRLAQETSAEVVVSERRRPNGNITEIIKKPLPGFGTVTTYTDITERWRWEARLKDSEALKRAMLETALDCVIAIDSEGLIIEFNTAAERTFGFARDEALGRRLAELVIPPRLRQAHLGGFRHHLATGATRVLGRRIELTAIRKDGSELPVELAITRAEIRGRPVFTAYLRNIAQRHRDMAALREAKAAAESVARAKSRFLANMSHELRTPLNAVLGFASLIREGIYGEVPARIDEVLGRIDVNGRLLLDLINDLLDLTRIESGEFSLTHADYSLAELARNALAVTEPLAAAKGLRLEVSLAEPMPTGHGDARA